MPKLSIYTKIRLGLYVVPRKAPAHIRFWRDVDMNGPLHPDLKTRCWIWLGSRANSNQLYGCISVHNRSVLAHRFSWNIHFGEIPSGLLVCHHCDNPSCVNPKHLFLGDHAQNHKDRNTKNRQAKGEKQGSSKLTADDVSLIRKLYVFGSSTHGTYGLSKMFGVSQREVWKIVNSKQWVHQI